MSRPLQFLSVIAVVTTCLLGCNDKDFQFIGDSALEPGFPPGGGGAGGGLGDGGLPPEGDISFRLTWIVNGPIDPDIDMWVIEPSGDTLSTSVDTPYYAGNPTPSGGLIDYDDTGGGSSGFGGPERAYWPTGMAPAGTYQFGIRWYDGSGSVDYTFRVYIGTSVANTYTGTLVDPGGGGLPEGLRVPLGAVDFP